MRFTEHAEQGFAYHVVSIIDLERTLTEGIRFDAKNTYTDKYIDFHRYFDLYKPLNIPEWVQRKKAIFASISFKEGHKWHSHSAILRIKLQEDRCWICNENLANIMYEPFILQSIDGFSDTREYMRINGRAFVEEYWNNSLSYDDNLRKRYDKREGYDAEVLIMHAIPPKNIECLYIVSDHQMLNYKEWQDYFKPESIDIKAQYNRYLQPESISSDSNSSGPE